MTVAALVAVTACGTAPAPPMAEPQARVVPPPARAASMPGFVAGRGERLLVYVPGEGDTLASVAARLLGSADLAWRIAESNGQRWELRPGEPVVVPLVAPRPGGVSADAVQAVPILSYHRFGSPTSKMVVAPAQFEAQLDWLHDNHYQVVRLADLAAFLQGRTALPQRSVVITIDDGYESAYRIAYPALKKRGLPATLFIPTDFIGARDALSWTQLEEMSRSGLIDIQPHSRTHRSLTVRREGESDAAWREAIDAELRQPLAQLERRLGTASRPRALAYPFGDVDDAVLESMQRQSYELGLTVDPGGNPFYAPPQMLRRTMIFGDQDLEAFKARLMNRRGALRP